MIIALSIRITLLFKFVMFDASKLFNFECFVSFDHESQGSLDTVGDAITSHLPETDMRESDG